MPCSIEIHFDPLSARCIHALGITLDNITGRPYMAHHAVHPHLTLAIVQADPPPATPDLLAKVAADLPATPLTRQGIASFPGPEPVVHLAFAKCDFLTQAHRRVQAMLDHLNLPNHPLYHLDRWIPHCTLAQGFPPRQLPAALEAAQRHPLDAPIVASTLCLVRYPPVKLLWQAPLRATATES